jgi:hypothetical protein
MVLQHTARVNRSQCVLSTFSRILYLSARNSHVTTAILHLAAPCVTPPCPIGVLSRIVPAPLDWVEDKHPLYADKSIIRPIDVGLMQGKIASVNRCAARRMERTCQMSAFVELWGSRGCGRCVWLGIRRRAT